MANADNLLNSLSDEERKMISGLQQMTGVQDLRQIILSFKVGIQHTHTVSHS